MSYFHQVVDNLRNKYFELRTLEKRSDVMMKQVIDTFYLMEGINRLQADLDCLDLLIKNNNYLERVIKLKMETRQEVLNRKSKLKSIFTKPMKVITSSELYKQLMNKISKKQRTESAFGQLKRITHTQHIKISELMEMVQCTIVTNYEVLEQLQQISCLHLKTAETWNQLRNETQQLNENSTCEEKNLSKGIENMEGQNELTALEASKSNGSIITLCKNNKTTLVNRPMRMFAKAKLEIAGIRSKSFSEGEKAIGDGQIAENCEFQEVQSKTQTLSSSKSTEMLATINQLKGDFVDTKSEDGNDKTDEVLKTIIDSKSF